ncbi:hypothetical protein DPMN_037804 [Dreissena polymorpha]|uniref:HTH psq-type domain-containing protein n=1 Tax=Dreissena polymorpha TaxID=45954 RepID=A0A9D4RPJ3_DREPO|nr:hypothetical protein DPMN_037804 [Dreissena polymorpha]
MVDALMAVNEGMSVRRAAEQFNVQKSTLSDRETGQVKVGSVWRKKPRLSTVDEGAREIS